VGLRAEELERGENRGGTGGNPEERQANQNCIGFFAIIEQLVQSGGYFIL